jgi:hypothetical protein
MNDVTSMRTLDPVTQPISPARFAHFVSRTGQIDTMARWYQTVPPLRSRRGNARSLTHPAAARRQDPVGHAGEPLTAARSCPQTARLAPDPGGEAIPPDAYPTRARLTSTERSIN